MALRRSPPAVTDELTQHSHAAVELPPLPPFPTPNHPCPSLGPIPDPLAPPTARRPVQLSL